ncbi:hypothetical protein CE143_09645 [Photorhabdus luminescens]|uniref:Uncharacterized protein n=1 Tax=Photorhabdus akhurstii TaxID=171438 RepID=A0ABX8LS70_9GAMM|nr:hypothetical protein [Photorhabdus akhurstii]PQQ32626.1 hypothetical protein C6H69_13020 [Photorhabdus luminescens]MBS9426869.1 hypothetical protein [Photorhabdus akhurstii]PQQ37166.1 hypothetical protein C6H65_22305 [Photorhabdus luminescens]QXF33387.1 hypothetical protein B0X70_09730 [Photorhabdus akhurstii]UJD75183.1 hypothetical protein CE143_09645 [Photorhabdus luminescens]
MMTDKEINIVDSMKANFKSGVRLMPEAFSHLIDEAYKAYEIIDGAQGDNLTTGLKRDGKGKLTLNTQHSGGLNSNQGALALSLKPEGGLSFAGGGYLKLDAARQIQFADFFSLSRGARMEITQLLGLKRTLITRIVSPSPIEDEYFGSSVSLNAAGDCLAVGSNRKVYVYTRRKSGEWNISKPIVFEDTEPGYVLSSWRVGLDAAGDCLALGEIWQEVVHVYTRTKGVWDTKHPIVFSRVAVKFGENVSLNAAGDCLVAGGQYSSPFRMFIRTNGIWDTKKTILFPAPSDAYEFGAIAHLSAAGNRLAVCDDYISAIYVYTRTNGIWDTENPIKFRRPDHESSNFSRVFSLNSEGDRLAVGTKFYGLSDGTVYLYTCTNGIWDRENPIKFSAPASDVTYFGRALELNDAGDRLVVGAYSRVYVYTCLNDKWNMETPMEILNPSDNLSGFGGAVGLNKAGTSLVVGAGPVKLGSESEAGAVYIFENVK